MDGLSSFSCILFAVLVYYPEVGDAGLGMIVDKCCIHKLHCNMSIVFFYSTFQAFAGFSYERKIGIFFWAESFVGYVLF